MKNPIQTILMKFLRSHQLMQFIIYGVAAAILAGALWGTFQFVDPLPPSKVTIISGGPNGAYHAYAEQYAAYFAEQGYELEILESKGSMDNLEQISAPDSTIVAALMQGGITTPEEHPDLESLGSLYYEPVWLFHRKGLRFSTLSELKGKRIAIGSDGTGTAHLVTAILAENGITSETATLIPESAGGASDKLLNGEIDALFAIASIKSPSVRKLAGETDKVSLYSFKRAETYVRTNLYLKKLTLPPGGIDLVANLPAGEVTLLAPTANLVVKEDLHAAIKYLFLLAAAKAHSQGDMFARPGHFPNGEAVLFPLGSEAKNFHEDGPPFLMRYLPFQIAITVERLKILLIPLLTLLFPLFKITPPAYRWQIRRRIFKWYKHLKKVDTEAYEITTSEEAKKMLGKLERMDRKVLETSVPLSYTDYIYSLRIHIHLIQDRLEKMVNQQKDEDTAT